MARMEDWQREAEEQAKRYSDSIKNNNQYLVEQLAASKQNALNQLEEQNNNAMYNLNTNKSSINSTAENNAKQLDVARLLALKSNQQSLNRAGLGTQGLVGSQVNSINNNYNTNLSSVLNEKSSALRDLEKQKQNALLTYNTNRGNLGTEYDNNIANLKSSIDDKALSQYNSIYNSVLALKQQEYQNEQAELARQEAIRQYNENLALQKAQLEYQKQQDRIANAQRWAQINASEEGIDFTDGNDSSKMKTDASTYNTLSNAINESIRVGLTANTKDLLFNRITEAYKSGNLSSSDADKLADALEKRSIEYNKGELKNISFGGGVIGSR